MWHRITSIHAPSQGSSVSDSVWCLIWQDPCSHYLQSHFFILSYPKFDINFCVTVSWRDVKERKCPFPIDRALTTVRVPSNSVLVNQWIYWLTYRSMKKGLPLEHGFQDSYITAKSHSITDDNHMEAMSRDSFPVILHSPHTLVFPKSMQLGGGGAEGSVGWNPRWGFCHSLSAEECQQCHHDHHKPINVSLCLLHHHDFGVKQISIPRWKWHNLVMTRGNSHTTTRKEVMDRIWWVGTREELGMSSNFSVLKHHKVTIRGNS